MRTKSHQAHVLHHGQLCCLRNLATICFLFNRKRGKAFMEQPGSPEAGGAACGYRSQPEAKSRVEHDEVYGWSIHRRPWQVKKANRHRNLLIFVEAFLEFSQVVITCCYQYNTKKQFKSARWNNGFAIIGVYRIARRETIIRNENMVARVCA